MSDPRPIQRYTGNVPATANQGAAIMTPQGPAVIQIIDLPGSGTGGLGPVNVPPLRRKPGGINVLGAVTRRWWLVLVVFVIVGGGAFLAGANIKPQFEGRSKVSFLDNNPNGSGGGIGKTTIDNAIQLLNSRDIPLMAWRNPALRDAFPEIISHYNLDDPVDRAALLQVVKTFVDYDDSVRGSQVIDIIALQPTREKAAVVADAYADALVKFCTASVQSSVAESYQSLENDYNDASRDLAAKQKAIAELKVKYNSAASDSKLSGIMDQIKNLSSEQSKDNVAWLAAKQKYDQLTNNKQRTPAQDLEADKYRADEKAKDDILKTYTQELSDAYNDLAKAESLGKLPDHPDVIAAKRQIELKAKNLKDREKEVDAILSKKIDHQIQLEALNSVATAKDALDAARAQLAANQQALDTLMSQSKELSEAKVQIDELEREAQQVALRADSSYTAMNQAKLSAIAVPTAVFKIEQMAMVTPKNDNRIKVQAGGLVGGLFLGILLSLLVDKFDKRLRDPRDIEPLLGTPLLGTIPRIDELKRIKGDQARNLIAEEFRLIRTQILFGNPNLTQKLIAITSPNPGDGKTSLAVNLAISIAKAGRRVLLIDGDLRKPDVHRVFNIPDSPGFAEIVQGSHEPGACIKKTEVDGLEILPAGTPITRPSELLSRPEMARLLAALSELYDHIIIDTAPLLPVSDTHVLIGMMDGVIVSFNAEVERDVVAMTQEILLRNRANVIGAVMNQVKYRQSGSYHRGKSAYDSYYNSPRGVPAKNDKLTPVGK